MDKSKRIRQNNMMLKRYIEREDGRIEQLCEHGIGHTIAIPTGIKKKDEWAWWVHGCDSCHTD